MTDLELDKKLIAMIAQDSVLFGKSLKQIDSSFFKDEYSKIHKLLKTYYDKHRKLPSLDIIEKQIYTHKKRRINRLFFEFLKFIIWHDIQDTFHY